MAGRLDSPSLTSRRFGRIAQRETEQRELALADQCEAAAGGLPGETGDIGIGTRVHVV
jgi:acyl CoA:acetate/3-ketoacid CoA transferase alpha subunit